MHHTHSHAVRSGARAHAPSAAAVPPAARCMRKPRLGPQTASHACQRAVWARSSTLRRDLGTAQLNMPKALIEQIRAANEEWIKDALSNPLVHSSGRRIFLASSCAWAPFGW